MKSEGPPIIPEIEPKPEPVMPDLPELTPEQGAELRRALEKLNRNRKR